MHSKYNQHRFKDSAQNKESKSFAMPVSNRFVVKLLDLYLAKLIPNSEHFCMRPLLYKFQLMMSLGIHDKESVLTLLSILCQISSVIQEKIQLTH